MGGRGERINFIVTSYFLAYVKYIMLLVTGTNQVIS